MSEEEFDEQETSYSCDTCERDFLTKEQHERHMSEHRTCNLDGCTFTAHEKIIEKHIRMQHATGLYDKIRKLNTPEEIAKWIEDRKRNYPNKENIQKRYALQEELIKKGVRIQKNHNKFGRDKFRLASTAKTALGHSNYHRPQKRRRKPKVPKVSLINEKSDWNGNMFPFRGTSELFTSSEETAEHISDFEDDEWQHHAGMTYTKVNNSLSSLMAAYGSDSDDCNDPVGSVVTSGVPPTPKIVSGKNDSDNEPPEEVKILKTSKEDSTVVASTPVLNENAKTITSNAKSNKPKRKRAHQRAHKGKRNKQSINIRPSNFARNADHFPHNNFRRRRVTLLEKLLESEIRHERNLLLQCVRYVVENNFFRTEVTQ